MPRRPVDDDDDCDEDFDSSDSEFTAPDDDGDEPTIPCPYCGEEIHEDSPMCPHCENYLSREDVAPTRKPIWFIVGAVAALYAVYLWIAG